MSAAFDEVFGVLIDAGMDPKKAASLLNQITLDGAAAVSRPEPTSNALRVRKHRERKAALQKCFVTPEMENLQSNQQNVALHVMPIPNNPKKEEEKKEIEVKISDSASAEPSKQLFGYVSFDKSVSFSRPEITTLESKCYSLTNVYGQIRSLAESDWMATMRPQDRKRAIENKIKKNHDNRVRTTVQSPQERIATVADVERIRRDKSDRAAEFLTRQDEKRRASGGPS